MAELAGGLGLGRVPNRIYPILTGGGGIFPSSFFARIEDFTIVGWQNMPGGTTPGPRGPPRHLYPIMTGGGGISHQDFLLGGAGEPGQHIPSK